MFFIFKFLSGWIKSSWKSQAFNWDTLNRPLYGELATFHICVVNWVFFRVELQTFLFGLVGWLNSVLRFWSFVLISCLGALVSIPDPPMKNVRGTALTLQCLLTKWKTTCVFKLSTRKQEQEWDNVKILTWQRPSHCLVFWR